MIKEIREEIRFIVKNPLMSLLVIGTITGILPSLLCGFLGKIFGIN